jgi:hypothetical protein
LTAKKLIFACVKPRASTTKLVIKHYSQNSLAGAVFNWLMLHETSISEGQKKHHFNVMVESVSFKTEEGEMDVNHLMKDMLSAATVYDISVEVFLSQS